MRLQRNWEIICVVTTTAFLRVFQNSRKLLVIQCATCFFMVDWGDLSRFKISGRISVVTVFGRGGTVFGGGDRGLWERRLFKSEGSRSLYQLYTDLQIIFLLCTIFLRNLIISSVLLENIPELSNEFQLQFILSGTVGV